MTSPAGSDGRKSYLRERLGELYPAPMRVLLPGDPPATGVPVTRYLALPSARTVRVLVPAHPSSASARSVRLQLSGSRLRTKAMRTVMAAAARSGALRFAPGVPVTVTGSGESIEEVLRRELGLAELLITMPVGPRRATRKSVLQVTDRSGVPVAFVKVGHDALTRSLVRHEGEVLAALDRTSWTSLTAPRVLARSEWRGLSLLAISPLQIPNRLREGPAARAALESVVRQVARSGDVDDDAGNGARALRLRISDALRGVSTPASPGLASEMAALVEEDAPLPLGCWHGDLNPGNLVLGPERVPVWDWERFETGVPLGSDLLHHDLMSAITVRGQPPLAAAEELIRDAPATLRVLGVERTAALSSARLYLLMLAARYLGDKQVEAGASLGRVEDWLVPALRRTREENDR